MKTGSCDKGKRSEANDSSVILRREESHWQRCTEKLCISSTAFLLTEPELELELFVSSACCIILKIRKSPAKHMSEPTVECQQLALSHPGSVVTAGIQESWLVFITCFLPMYIHLVFLLCTTMQKENVSLLVAEIHLGTALEVQQFGLMLDN